MRLPSGTLLTETLSKSTGSTSEASVTQLIFSHGTPYSDFRSPSASTDMVVCMLRTATRLPIRSSGSSMPEASLTKMWFWLNRRRGNTGIAVIGTPREVAMIHDENENSQISNSLPWIMRRWRSIPSRRGGAMPTSSGFRLMPSGGVTSPMKNGT